MKIAIDISQIVYAGSGVSSYTHNLIETLLSIDKKNDYQLFGMALRRLSQLKRHAEMLSGKRVTLKSFIMPPILGEIIWNKLHILPLDKLIGSPDIIHTSDWIEPPSAAAKITTIHDLVVYKFPESLPLRIINNQKNKLRWVTQESRMIIADSESTKQDIIAILGINPGKIRVIHLGVSDKFRQYPPPAVETVKRKYGIFMPYLFTVGTREPRKNLSRIIKAFLRVNQKDLQLVIAGKVGWGSDIKPNKSVLVTGYVDSTDLPLLYSGAWAFIYPSLYEGFGLPALEAMRSGVPVITSNRGSLAEIVGNYALIVDPESVDSIATGMEYAISLSSSKRKQIVDSGITHAQKFTWEKTAKETLETYETLI